MFLGAYKGALKFQYLRILATAQWILVHQPSSIWRFSRPPLFLGCYITKTAPGIRGLALKAAVSGASQEFHHEPKIFISHTPKEFGGRNDVDKSPEIRKALSAAYNPVADYIRKNREDKAVCNRLLKDKGIWSYDWRVPLAELEKHFNPDIDRGRVGPRVRVIGRVRRVPICNVRADQIPKPATWTARTFFTHVWNLTTSSVDRLVARKMYGKGQTHAMTVAAILEELFQDVALRQSITVESCNAALDFMTKHSMFGMTRKLFERIQQLQMDTDTSTFNILLKAAAHQKDLFNFTFILKTMISYGVKPDPQTWLHLVNTVPDDEPRRAIVERMREKGMLQQRSVRKNIVASVVRHELVSHLESGQDLSSFLDELDNRWGINWMSVGVGVKILDEMRLRGPITEIITVLQLLCERGFKPTKPTLLLLLKQNSYTRDHELSVKFLHLFRTKYEVEPSEQIYDVLFTQAWRSQLYNCCRVLWTHACVSGVASFHMQERVKASLFTEQYPPSDPTSRWKAWFSTAGKVIAGHGPNTSTSAFARLMSMLQPSEGSSQKSNFRQAVRRILADDLTLSSKYYTKYSLDESLAEAWRKDRQWSLGHALRKAPILCKYGQILNVRLEARASQRTPQESDSCPIFLASTTAPDQQSDEQNQGCEMSPEMRSRSCTCKMAAISSPQASPGQASWKLEALD